MCLKYKRFSLKSLFRGFLQITLCVFFLKVILTSNLAFFCLIVDANRWMILLENPDIVLSREILHIQTQSKRHGSFERGQLWDEIAVVLTSLADMNLKVTTRLVRDRYTLLVKKYKKSRVRKREQVLSTQTTQK